MKWYLLKTKFRQEKKSSIELSNQGIDNFFPIYQKEVLCSGKVSYKDEPLFSRYIFINVDPNKINWNALRSTKGISNIVSFGSGPQTVSNKIVEALRKLKYINIEKIHEKGDSLSILRGPLKGLNAIYEAPDGDSRSIVLLQFLQQDQKLTLKNEDLKKLH